MELQKKSKKRNALSLLITALFLIMVASGVIVALYYFEKDLPVVKFDKEIQFLGKETDLAFSVEDAGSGIKSLELSIVQNGKEHVLYTQEFPKAASFGQMGPLAVQESFTLNTQGAGVKEGEAVIILEARDYSFRNFLGGNETVSSFTVTIDTTPPKIHLLHAERYISPGGSGLVIYRVEGQLQSHGAYFGGYTHKGHLIGDGRDDVYVAYIGLPYDAQNTGESKIYATDQAGNTHFVPFSPIFKSAVQKKDTINIPDSFLQKKIPEFQNHYPEMSGSMEERYLYTNNTVRQENNRKIYEICRQSGTERLWSGKFNRMAGASRAGFADHRTYYYHGKEIDKQVHLGMDIASTRRAGVKAANTGVVAYADYLGIYGNMVILDHGQGVFSLYSHLSQINVASGDTIEQGSILGLTGTSGMAGGDHLHFSMLINGIFVTPKEWWDPQWVEVTIEGPLADSKFQ